MICKKQFIIKKPQIIRLIKIFSELFQAEKKENITAFAKQMLQTNISDFAYVKY